MENKKAYKKNKKNAIKKFFLGDYLSEEFLKHYKYFLLICILGFIIIYCNNWVNDKIRYISSLNEQVEEYKSRNAFAQSKLIRVKMESELGKEMIKDSLLPLENHPHKLLIKIDSIKK